MILYSTRRSSPTVTFRKRSSRDSRRTEVSTFPSTCGPCSPVSRLVARTARLPMSPSGCSRTWSATSSTRRLRVARARRVRLPGPDDARPARHLVLELFHGADDGLQGLRGAFLARIFGHLLAERGDHATILVATSGDTGARLRRASLECRESRSSCCTRPAASRGSRRRRWRRSAATSGVGRGRHLRRLPAPRQNGVPRRQPGGARPDVGQLDQHRPVVAAVRLLLRELARAGGPDRGRGWSSRSRAATSAT